MINIVIAYDDNDDELGDYFELGYMDLFEKLKSCQNITLNSIRGLNCSESAIVDCIESFDEDNFGFVGFSHGNDCQLVTENEVYVDINNIDHFENSLFYSTACSTGIQLGAELVKVRCKCFIGFKNETYATYEDFYDIYLECENYCLTDFLLKDNTIKESFDNMLVYFDKKILEMENDDEILVAMELIGNRDSFVIYGDTTITNKDLN